MSSKCMRACFLLGVMKVTVIRCHSGLVGMTLVQIVRDQVQSPIEVQNFFYPGTYEIYCYIYSTGPGFNMF